MRANGLPLGSLSLPLSAELKPRDPHDTYIATCRTTTKHNFIRVQIKLPPPPSPDIEKEGENSQILLVRTLIPLPLSTCGLLLREREHSSDVYTHPEKKKKQESKLDSAPEREATKACTVKLGSAAYAAPTFTDSIWYICTYSALLIRLRPPLTAAAMSVLHCSHTSRVQIELASLPSSEANRMKNSNCTSTHSLLPPRVCVCVLLHVCPLVYICSRAPRVFAPLLLQLHPKGVILFVQA